MAEIQRVCWDSCAWIGLINEEPAKCEGCENIIALGRNKEVQIYTSTFSLVEVYKARCKNGSTTIEEERFKRFEEFLQQPFVTLVQLDKTIGIVARNLLRKYQTEGLKKPQDAVHLATAFYINADELHTYDISDLLCLSGKVQRQDGTTIKICNPPPPLQSNLPGTRPPDSLPA